MSDAAKADKGMFGDFSLSKMFTGLVVGGLKLATIGLFAAVAWQVFLDPIFFPIFHDVTNTTAQAWVHFIHQGFSWIPELLGLTGDGGLLNTEFMQRVLSNSYEVVSIPTDEEIASVPLELIEL